MPTEYIQRIQDAVHGLMEFHGMESFILRLLDTKEIQRLRRIRQLGAASFVFPSAEHSRFSHALGSAYIAIRLARQISEEARKYYTSQVLPNDEASRDFAVAALCHDLGHGPLSHAWEENVIGSSFDRQKWIRKFNLDEKDNRLKKLKWHELVTLALLSNEQKKQNKIYRVLKSHDSTFPQRMQAFQSNKYFLPYLP